MKKGPIDTVMEWVPGNPEDFNATEGCVYDGVPEMEKGSGGKIKEVTFDEAGEFGRVPMAEK